MAYKRILVPVDGSAASKAGLREAISLAKGQGAALQLVHVADQHYLAMMGLDAAAGMTALLETTRRSGQDVLRNAQAMARKAGVEAATVLLETMTGPAADPIVKQAKKW